MTVDELKRRLEGVPDHYEVIVEHGTYDGKGEPVGCECSPDTAGVDGVRLGVARVSAFVITARSCP